MSPSLTSSVEYFDFHVHRKQNLITEHHIINPCIFLMSEDMKKYA
uniref:Uncharacterized protein n=1 Tax=Arundo donax TaxID=35708 RepID=A0A0A9G8I6_ARUDO